MSASPVRAKAQKRTTKTSSSATAITSAAAALLASSKLMGKVRKASKAAEKKSKARGKPRLDLSDSEEPPPGYDAAHAGYADEYAGCYACRLRVWQCVPERWMLCLTLQGGSIRVRLASAVISYGDVRAGGSRASEEEEGEEGAEAQGRACHEAGARLTCCWMKCCAANELLQLGDESSREARSLSKTASQRS
jgi:hypothetical protein